MEISLYIIGIDLDWWSQIFIALIPFFFWIFSSLIIWYKTYQAVNKTNSYSVAMGDEHSFIPKSSKKEPSLALYQKGQ